MTLVVIWCLWFGCPDAGHTHEDAPESIVSTSVAPDTYQGMGSDVEQWRGLVSAYFSDVDMALCVIQYESGGNPDAYNPSGASGLFQVMNWWAPEFGYEPADLFTPEINVSIASQIHASYGWGAWSVYNKGLCP